MSIPLPKKQGNQPKQGNWGKKKKDPFEHKEKPQWVLDKKKPIPQIPPPSKEKYITAPRFKKGGKINENTQWLIDNQKS